MLIKKILAVKSSGMVHSEGAGVVKAQVLWQWPGLSGRSQRLGPGLLAVPSPLAGCSWTYLPFTLAQPWLFSDAFISQVTVRTFLLAFPFSL